MTQDQEAAINFQIRRIFASLGRDVIVLFEDLKKTHDNNFNKLKDNLPLDCGPVVDMSDYFDDNMYAYWRKKTLDVVNQAKRDLESTINQ